MVVCRSTARQDIRESLKINLQWRYSSGSFQTSGLLIGDWKKMLKKWLILIFYTLSIANNLIHTGKHWKFLIFRSWRTRIRFFSTTHFWWIYDQRKKLSASILNSRWWAELSVDVNFQFKQSGSFLATTDYSKLMNVATSLSFGFFFSLPFDSECVCPVMMSSQFYPLSSHLLNRTQIRAKCTFSSTLLVCGCTSEWKLRH